jgi:hypothetical protein
MLLAAQVAAKGPPAGRSFLHYHPADSTTLLTPPIRAWLRHRGATLPEWHCNRRGEQLFVAEFERTGRLDVVLAATWEGGGGMIWFPARDTVGWQNLRSASWGDPRHPAFADDVGWVGVASPARAREFRRVAEARDPGPLHLPGLFWNIPDKEYELYYFGRGHWQVVYPHNDD